MPLPERRGQQILQLREFHLQPPFGRAGAFGKDIEDQLRPVDDLDAGGAFQVALLGGSQIVIHDQNVGLRCLRHFPDFLHLALPEQRGGVGIGARLKRLAHNFDAGASGKFE